MAKIISGDIYAYVRQLIFETLGFEEIQGNVLENCRTSENPQNSPPKGGSKISRGVFRVRIPKGEINDKTDI